jgi:uroporphyrinogen-III decarboxylase
MNPRQRILAVLRGEPADRVPLWLGGYRMPKPEETEDPAVREMIERVNDQLHFPYQVNAHVNRWLVTPPQYIREVSREEKDGEETLTTEIDTPKGKLSSITGRNAMTKTGWAIKYPVENLEDLEKLRSVPSELPPDIRPPDFADKRPDFDTKKIVSTHISSPFVCVAAAMSYEYFLELCITEPKLIKELTDLCLERILSRLDVVLSEKTIECVWMGGCEWVTPPMASPKIYEDLVQPYEKTIIDKCHEAGALVHVHCHGNVRSTIEMVVERGADFFEPVEPPPDGDITFAEAKEIVAGRMTLGGNIESRVLENESADRVEEAVRAAFEGGKERMVLEPTAGPVGPITPRMIENYHRMIDVWEELSPM